MIKRELREPVAKFDNIPNLYTKTLPLFKRVQILPTSFLVRKQLKWLKLTPLDIFEVNIFTQDKNTRLPN